MKVLFVSNYFPPTHTGGTEKRTLGYALHLRAMGHTVQVVSVGKWDVGEGHWNGFQDEDVQGIPVRRIHLNWKRASDANRSLYANPVVEAAVRQWIGEWQPDIVHVTSAATASASVIQAAKDHQIPVVLTLTDFWFICPRSNLLRGDGSLCSGRTTPQECLRCMLWENRSYRTLQRILPEPAADAVFGRLSRTSWINQRRGLRGLALDMRERKTYLAQMLAKVDYLIAPSKYLADIFKASGVTRPIHVIQSGHDLKWLQSMPEKKRSDRIRFGYIGQIAPHKGVDVLLKAFHQDSIQQKAELSIFGDLAAMPDYAGELQTSVGGKNGVQFRGSFSPDQLGEVFTEIDVLIVPSRWHENNPRVIQEAFASKTPVIASDVGGIAEFVQHEENGLIFERDDAESLSRQLCRVVEEPGLLENLRNGIAEVKLIEEEVKELEAVYLELVGQPGR